MNDNTYYMTKLQQKVKTLQEEVKRLKAEKDTLAKGFAEWVDDEDYRQLDEGAKVWTNYGYESDQTTSELLEEYKKQMP